MRKRWRPRWPASGHTSVVPVKAAVRNSRRRSGRPRWSQRQWRRTKSFFVLDSRSTEKVLKFNGSVSLVVTIFDDDRGVNGKSPLRGFAFSDGPRTGNDYGVLRHGERRVRSGAVYLSADHII